MVGVLWGSRSVVVGVRVVPSAGPSRRPIASRLWLPPRTLPTPRLLEEGVRGSAAGDPLVGAPTCPDIILHDLPGLVVAAILAGDDAV